jgi:hypothetical protein
VPQWNRLHYHGPIAIQPNDVPLGFKTANAHNT